MKILLASPVFPPGLRHYFPSGLAMVSAVLKRAGHDVHCLNLDLAEDWEASFRETFARLRPDVLGSGGMTPAFGFLKGLFDLAKELDPKVLTVLGGGVLGSEPLVFGALRADIGVVGEGEATALELMDALKAGRDLLPVAGLMLRDADGRVVTTAARPSIDDLDSLPLADYHGFEFGQCLSRNGFQTINTSRGCPFHCTFCYCTQGRGRYRFNSIGQVIKELAFLKHEFRITQIGLIDEIFALKRERILEFCEQVRPLGLSWSTQVRVDVVDRELLDTMREAGCNLLFYGLESMNKAVLASMRKRLKPEKVAEVLEMTHASGIGIFGNFIFGDPAETTETAWETLDWWRAHRKYGINLGKIDCWPGTQIYKQAIGKGVIADPLEYIGKGCPLVNLTAMDRQEWLAMLRRVWLSHEALVFPCRLLEMDEGAAECVCPHCKTRVRLSGLDTAPVHPDRGAQRLSCPECGRHFDMPLRVPPLAFPAALEERFEKALKARRDGDADKALAVLDEFKERGWDHPLAAYLAALCHLERGDPFAASEAARLGLRHNPVAAYLLEMAAAAYRRLGDGRLGAVLLEQALLIRKAREKAVTDSNLARLDPLEARFMELFPDDAVNLDAGVGWAGPGL